jgi:hypothetical protein
MKHLPKYRLVLLVMSALWITGCGGGRVIVVSHPPHGPGHPGHRGYPDDAEVIYVDDEATIAEIDAVRTLDFSSQRADHLNRIARRPDLGPDAQAYLVDTAFNVLDFESEKMRVIQTLIKNPTFTATGKTRIFNRLDDLDFSSNRQRILRDMDRRGPVIDYAEEPVYEQEVVIEVPGVSAPVTPEGE